MKPKVTSLCFFIVAVCLGLAGCFLAFDTFVPKERTVSVWGLIAEFIIGIALIGLAIWLGRKNRLSQRAKT
jgi:hypothetical protein